MPIFEYECESCSKKFEELVSSSDTPVVCPQCSSTQTRKLLSVFAASVGGTSSSATPCGAPSCGSGFG